MARRKRKTTGTPVTENPHPLDPLRITISPYWPASPTPKQHAALAVTERIAEEFPGEPVELLYGGAGGGGKSWLILMAASQFAGVFAGYPYSSLILRRSYPELSQEGGLIEVSKEWWGGRADVAAWSEQNKRWTFQDGSKLQFGYAETELDAMRYSGGRYDFIAWDELTLIRDARAYRLLFSRVRRPVGSPIPPRVLDATNPVGPGVTWVEERWDPEGKHKTRLPPTRLFLPAYLADNPYIDQEAYIKSLGQLSRARREAILHGRWVRETEHTIFPRDDLRVIEEIWGGAVRIRSARAWDLASSTAPTASRTAGFRVGVYALPVEPGQDKDERPVIEHGIVGRWRPAQRDEVILQTARNDGPETTIVLEQEPGSGGDAQCAALEKKLVGYHVVRVRASSRGSKVQNAGPMSSAWCSGNLWALRGPWLSEFLDQAEAFSEEVGVDEIDSAATAFNHVLQAEYVGGAAAV